MTLPVLVHSAQNYRGFEFGLNSGPAKAAGGFFNYIDEDNTMSAEIGDGDGYGLTLSYLFSSYHGFELYTGMVTNDYFVEFCHSFYSYDPPSPLVTEHTTEIFFLNFNGIIQVPLGPFIPYITGGYGWVAFIDEAPFAPNFGGGLKIYVSKHIALRAHYCEYSVNLKDQLGEGETPPNIQVPEIVIPYSDKIHFYTWIFGLLFNLGKVY